MGLDKNHINGKFSITDHRTTVNNADVNNRLADESFYRLLSYIYSMYVRVLIIFARHSGYVPTSKWLKSPIFIYPVVCYRKTPGYHAYVLWVYDPPPSSLANLDNPDKLTWLLPITLQTVVINRWRHNEYSCWSSPSFLYSYKAHLLSSSDQRSGCQTWCGKMLLPAL